MRERITRKARPHRPPLSMPAIVRRNGQVNQCEKKTLKKLNKYSYVMSRTVLLLFSAIVIAVVYAEIFGLPKFTHGYVRQVLRNRGINLEFARIRPGLIGDLKLEKAVLYDGLAENAGEMARAERLIVETGITDWLFGDFAFSEVQIKNGALLFPLTDDPEYAVETEKLDLSLQNLRVTALPDGGWRVKDARLNLMGVKISGQVFIQRPEEKKPEFAAFSEESPLSWRRFPGLFSEEIRDGLLMTRELALDNRFHVLPASGISFEAEYQGSSDASDKGQMTVEVGAERLFYRFVPIRNFAGRITYMDGSLEFSDFRAEVRGKEWDHWESLRAEASYDIQEERLNAFIDGSLHPSVLRNLRPLFGKHGRHIDEFSFSDQPLSFSFRLSESRMPFSDWQGEASLGAREFKFRQMAVSDLRAEVMFTPDEINTGQGVSLNLEKPGEEVELSFLYDRRERQLSGRIAGAADFTRLYLELGLPRVRQLGLLDFNGPPPRFDFTLEPSSIDEHPLEWRGKGEFSGEEIEYEGLKMDEVSGKVEVAERSARFFDLTTKLPVFELFHLDFLEFFLEHPERPAVKLSGEAEGDPRHVDVFLGRDRPRQAFHRIWEDFEWSDKAPRFELETMHYQRYPTEKERWRLVMLASFSGQDIQYRGEQADEVSGRIELNLPEEAKVKDILVLDNAKGRNGEEEDRLEGDMRFELGQNPVWYFESRGRLDPARIFSAVTKGEDDGLSEIEFSPSTDVELKGKAYLRGSREAEVFGRFSGESMKFMDFSFNEHELEWELAGRDLRWRLKHARLHDGSFSGKGVFNTFTRAGYVDMDMNQVSIAGLLEDFEDYSPEFELGRLTSSIQVNFQQWDSKSDLSISGNGKIWVRDAEFWEAPVLKNLGDAVGLGRLGRISELDAKLDFIGDQVLFSRLNTDGTVFSLQGEGSYRWRDDYLDFVVRGRSLRSTPFLGMVLRPLSWLFEARLTGPVGEAEWSVDLLTGLRGGDD